MGARLGGLGGLYLLLMLSSCAARIAGFQSGVLKRGVRFSSSWAGSRRGPLRSSSSSSETPAAAAPSLQEEWSSARVRSTFVEYFQEKQAHTFYPSSPVVPFDDPTLLFVNAGMNQFKSVFLGQTDPKGPLAGLSRAVNSQKCIRAGGKHNDLEDVGRDTYHHTFFEMLGTWSFGDYFKSEAIEWSFDILTKTYGLQTSRLYASYFGGDEAMGLEADTEARDFWLRLLPAERVVPFGTKDNFWEMGDVGPCGPCSELHYDLLGGRDAAPLVNMDDPTVIEIWNLVFIQFNREEDGSLKTLPAKHIDTGMGLERLVTVLQDKKSNYDTDVFTPIFDEIREKTGAPAYGGKLGEEDPDFVDTAYRVVADHMRTLVFAIGDGAIPSNEGRGYVLRRILRRAVRYAQQKLGAKPGVLTSLVPVVVERAAPFFTELPGKQAMIEEVIAEEEASFNAMLDRGIKYFEEISAENRATGDAAISGGQAFFLYDSLGFPVDLTQVMAEEVDMTVDMQGFELELEQQKKRSREAAKLRKSGGAKPMVLEAAETAWLAQEEIPTTDDAAKYRDPSQTCKEEVKVLALFDGDSATFMQSLGADSAEEGRRIGVILDKSPFYAESGGQEADIGHIRLTNGAVLDVLDAQNFAGYVLHICSVAADSSGAEISVGAGCVGAVDGEARRRVAPNHTMTHVLNFALRQVLGGSVDQRGSLVSQQKLRFDFSHNKALTSKELEKVEGIVQSVIEKEQPVYSAVVPLEKAKAISGLRPVFGEAYPDPVRVISVGLPIEEMVSNPEDQEWGSSSVEFCGGTHLSNTADAAAFVLCEETAVAKGIRRITAVTGEAATTALKEGRALEEQVEQLKTLPITEVDKKANSVRQAVDASPASAALKSRLRGELESQLKRVSQQQKLLAAQSAEKGVEEARAAAAAAVEAGSVGLVTVVNIGGDSKAVKQVLTAVQKEAPGLAFMGLSPEDAETGSGKLLVFTLVPDKIQESSGLKANEWLNAALEPVGGRGGGRPGNAQGQAADARNIDDAVQAARQYLEREQ